MDRFLRRLRYGSLAPWRGLLHRCQLGEKRPEAFACRRRNPAEAMHERLQDGRQTDRPFLSPTVRLTRYSTRGRSG